MFLPYSLYASCTNISKLYDKMRHFCLINDLADSVDYGGLIHLDHDPQATVLLFFFFLKPIIWFYISYFLYSPVICKVYK